MDVHPIRTEADHAAALDEIERLRGAPVGSPEGDRLKLLATLVEAYETAHHPAPQGRSGRYPRFAIDDIDRVQSSRPGTLFDRVMSSLQQALSHARGEAVPGLIVHRHGRDGCGTEEAAQSDRRDVEENK